MLPGHVRFYRAIALPRVEGLQRPRFRAEQQLSGESTMKHRTNARGRIIRERIRLASIALVFGLTACGGDAAGPDADADVVGSWALSLSGTASTGRTCTVGNVTLTFAGSGGAIGGTATFGGANSIVCNPGGPASFSGDSPIENVGVTGRNVAFTYRSGSGTWNFSGAQASSGNTMSGNVTFPLAFSSTGVSQFTGTWTATRN